MLTLGKFTVVHSLQQNMKFDDNSSFQKSHLSLFPDSKTEKKTERKYKKNEKPARKVCKEKVINSTKEMQNDVF